MRKSVNSAVDDVIIEPIEEAVALYDDLLKDLSKFMVSSPSSNCSHARSVATVSRVPSGHINLWTYHICAAQSFRDHI